MNLYEKNIYEYSKKLSHMKKLSFRAVDSLGVYGANFDRSNILWLFKFLRLESNFVFIGRSMRTFNKKNIF